MDKIHHEVEGSNFFGQLFCNNNTTKPIESRRAIDHIPAKQFYNLVKVLYSTSLTFQACVETSM